jgi:hypothetical protein
MFQFTQNETNALRRRIFFYASSPSDGYTNVTTGLGVTTTVEVTKNGVLPATLPLAPAFTHVSSGLWYYEMPSAYLDTVGILTVTIIDPSVMRTVQAVGYVYAGDPLSTSSSLTSADIWTYSNRTLTGSVSVSGNVTVGGFTAGAITNGAFASGAITNAKIANDAIILRLANDALPSNARFTTYDTFSGYPVLSQSAQHQISITGSHHAAADVHEFQANVITNTATNASFVTEMVNAIWDELYAGHTTTGSFAMLLKAVLAGNFAITGTVSTVTNSQVFTTSLIGYVDGAFDHQTLVFMDGSLAGESKPIFEFTGASGGINMEEAFTQSPAPGDMFAILPQHVHAIESIADGILNRLLDSSGNSVDVFNERTVRSALRAMRNKVEVNNGTIIVYKEGDADAAWEGTLSNTADVTVNPDGGS